MQSQDFLSGKTKQIQENLVQEMQLASESLDYEKAGVMRDRVRAIPQVQQQNKMNNSSVGDADLISFFREDDDCCVQICSFRGGRNYGSKNYFPKIHSSVGSFFSPTPVELN